MFLEWQNNSGKLQIISGKFQNSEKFQNNAINDVKQISLSHVIRSEFGDDFVLWKRLPSVDTLHAQSQGMGFFSAASQKRSLEKAWTACVS